VDLLRADHREAEELFEKYNAATRDTTRRSIADEVCRALTVHSLLEEEIFYPACRAGGVEAELLDEADTEHATAKALIAQIECGTPAERNWDAKVKVLCAQIEHHVQEEEGEEGIFDQARSAGLDLDALGAEMAARRAELMR
jgi:hemerythrin superfamily protein